jgi:hypothetical protein
MEEKMNERIRELADQAYEMTQDKFRHDWDGTPRQDWDSKFPENFAELIVRDCLSIADRRGAYEVMDDIIKHFGIEP